MSHSAARRMYIPESAHVARTLLSELRGAHRQLLAQLTAMEALTSETRVDATLLATRRWQLGQASLARRLLAARICDYYQARLDPGQRADMKALITADQVLLRESSVHLRYWAADRPVGDWASFCAASREMCRKTHAHVALEQKLLYPMLARAADRA